VPQLPLDSIAPVPPQVSYQDGQLTIVAPNSTLADILKAVRKQTGAEIDIPDAKERVATHLGPGPARDVIAELLNGSRFNYVLLGSPSDAAALTRVVLVAKTGPDNASAVNQPAQPPQATNQAARMAQPQDAAEANDADAAEENADDNADQAPSEAEQPATQPEQPGVKTPQQMLQEMQQRQLQMQQQQQMQQPGPGIPPRPPQEQ
jgi:flagellar biosynthesis GTPase FlhF